MAKPTDINPRTGKRYDFVPPPRQQSFRAELASLEAAGRAAAYEVAAKAARSDLLAYTRFTMPDPVAPLDVSRSKYEEQVFHVEVAKALEAVERGEVPQLIFCMPPRHGKTELATKRFAAWCAGRHPDWDIAVASYSDDMARDMGADTRAILTSAQHKKVFPDYKMRRGGTAKDNIQTDVGGRMVFVGRGGPLTGRGMHLGLGDDLFKDHEEARSPAIRDQAWNWFVKVFMTRRMGRKLVILTMTRWHADDIIGRITDPENPHYSEEEAKCWKIIRLPALAEDEDDPLGRKPGEALWEERYGRDFLESQRRLDPLGFAALYQQTPSVADGVYFLRENIRYYKSKDLPERIRIYCASDHAVGTKQRNDPSCMLKVGVDDQHNIYLIDCDWRRMAADVQIEAMIAMGCDHPLAPLIWWAEKGHVSKAIGPFLKRRLLDDRKFLNLVEVTPAVDKVQRSASIAGMVGQGRVFFPSDKAWTERAINELMAFPNGLRDDFVDTLSYIGLGLRSQVRGPKEPIAEAVPKFGTLAWVKWTEKWKRQQAERKRRGGF